MKNVKFVFMIVFGYALNTIGTIIQDLSKFEKEIE